MERPVTDEEIEQIVRCGSKAPSSRNNQPWKFMVIRNQEKIRTILPKAKVGNALIIILGPDTRQEGMNIDSDCALATQNMHLAAQGLSLRARIYTGPIQNINENLKEKLDMEGGYRIIAILRIGHKDQNLDTISFASPRKPIKEIVIYR